MSHLLDEIALYNTALSPARIAAHYAAASAGTYTAAVLADLPRAYYKFDEQAQTQVLDAWPGRPVMVEINGASARELTLVNTVKVTDTLGQQVTAEFSLVNPGVAPKAGDLVRMLFHRWLLFAGSVDSIEFQTNNTQTARVYKCRATDFSQILIRRKIRRNFINLSVANIVDSVVDNELAGEGLTIAAIDRSSSLPLAEAKGGRIFDFFRDVAGVTGQTFYVDFEKGLRFNNVTNLTAPDLTEATVESASLTADRETYRNRQTVVCTGTPSKASQEDALVTTVTQDNAVEIAARAAIEGGTGIYEEVEEITHPSSNDGADIRLLALAYARLRLATSGQLRSTLKCRVRNYGYRAGMFSAVTLPKAGASGTWVIQSVNVTEEDGRRLVHDLELVQASLQQRAYESWLRIVTGGKVTVQMPGSLTSNLTSYNAPGTFTFTVPAGVTSLELTCYGPSAGGSGAAYVDPSSLGKFFTGPSSGPANGGAGGDSGKAITTIAVAAGETLAVTVGAAGNIGTNQGSTPNGADFPFDGAVVSATGIVGTSGSGPSTVTYRGIVVCQGNAGQVGTVGASAITRHGSGFAVIYSGAFTHGAKGTPGSGIGDAVSVGGGNAGGAGGVTNVSAPVIGRDGLVEIRY